MAKTIKCGTFRRTVKVTLDCHRLLQLKWMNTMQLKASRRDLGELQSIAVFLNLPARRDLSDCHRPERSLMSLA